MPELKATAFSATEGVRRRGHADLPLRSLGFFLSGVICVPRASKRREIHTFAGVSASGIPQPLARKAASRRQRGGFWRSDGSASI